MKDQTEIPEKLMRLACDGCKAYRIEGNKTICDLDYHQINGRPEEPCENPVTNAHFLRLSMANMRKKH
jgi:hypothetical protein